MNSVSDLTARVARRLGPGRNRWLQLATHWGAYIGYLDALTARLGTMKVAEVGEMPLADAYVPISLRPFQAEDPGHLEGATHGRTTLVEVLGDQSKVLVIGPAGTGKSALLRWHAVEAARAIREGGRRQLVGEGGPPHLPVYLALRDLPAQAIETASDDEWTQIVLAALRLNQRDFLDVHLQAGRTLLLLDDVDTLTQPQRAALARRILAFESNYPNNQLVVAVRDGSDRALFPGFEAYETAGIDPNRIEALLQRWGQGQLATASGLLQVLERCSLVRSLMSHPGWLGVGLAAAASAPRPLRAFDVVARFVQSLDADVPDDWPKVALALHQHHRTVGKVGQIAAKRRGSGLVQWLDDETFRFVHPAVQVYFAALAADADELVSRVGDPWWSPLVVPKAAELEAARPFVRQLMEGKAVEMAALALAELRPPPPDLARQAAIDLMDQIGVGSSETDRRMAVALAPLSGTDTVRRGGVTAPLLSALGASDAGVRRAAAAALARVGDAAAVAPLLTALGDKDAAVRDAVSEALAAFGDRTVQPLVRQLAVPDGNVRDAVIHALARQGKRAVAALVPLLDSASPGVRGETATALAGIGGAAVPELVQVLREAAPEGNRSEQQVSGAAEALTRIGPPAANALVGLYPEAGPALRKRINDIIRHMGQTAIAPLGSIVATSEHPQAGPAVALLGELSDEGAEAARHLVKALEDSRFEVRWEARRGLRRLGDASLEPLLGALLAEDPQLRWEAAEILLTLPNPPVEPLVAELTTMLKTTDVSGRRRAVNALGSLPPDKVRLLIGQAIDDADPLVRRSAIEQLARPDDSEAVRMLASRWPKEDDPDTAIRLLEALVELDPVASVGPLLDAMTADDDRVRWQAAELLGEVGEPAVVPLIEIMNQQGTKLDLNGALRFLDRLGSTARTVGQTPSNLAKTYYRMLTEPHEIDELVYLATTIEWWPPAWELHRTFGAAREFVQYKTLSGIADAEKELEWVDSVDRWLRPPAANALRQLRLISQAVQYYNRGATRRAKEKGLLAAADRLNTLRTLIPELGEPHTRVFHAVADTWNALINHAIRELQGKANLEVELRTELVRIREGDTAAVLVIELVNRGEGLASNIQLQLSMESGGPQLDSPGVQYLPPLGQGDRMAVEFTISAPVAGVVPLAIQVGYDDPQKGGQTRQFTREVRFIVEDAPYREIGSSPYIAGPPVKTPEMFYGRASVFAWIKENIAGTYQDNVLVLYGERRTGKTSVLYQLPYHVPDNYSVVLVDLQSIAYALSSTSELLYAMSRKVVSGLNKTGFELEKPDRAAYDAHPIEEFQTLGEEIGQLATQSGRRAIIIADEFDLLIEGVEEGKVSPYVFDTIRGLMQHQDGISFIFAGAHKLTAMIKNPQSILFNTALRRRVSFLDPDDALRLIKEPVKDVLAYDDLALEKIFRATAGQPYFIQYIGHELVNIARREMKNFISLRDVDRALQTTVEETTGIIRNAYNSLGTDQRVALAALGRITDDGRPFVSLDDLIETLEQDEVPATTRDMYETLRGLAERDFIIERTVEGTGRQYGFTMDLVRVWLEQNDEYARLLEELRG